MFEHFDPLQLSDKTSFDESFWRERQKRNIHSILHSYVGWYDPFSELIQNALDSVDKKAAAGDKNYVPKISIRIDTPNNIITVSDNGTGLDESSFEQFLAPNVSFKDGNTRGSKGVGATYLAYGFNYIRVDSKSKNFSASGEMENARNWLHDSAAAQNPRVYPCTQPPADPEFAHYESGVSISVKFDKNSRPSDISWPNLNNAAAWSVALRVKTALGAIIGKQVVDIKILHIDKSGSETDVTIDTAYYLAPHEHYKRIKKYEEVIEKLEANIKKHGASATLPGSIRNLDAVYIDWSSDDVVSNVDALSKEQIEFLKDHPVKIIGSYLYSARVWEELAKKLGCRTTANIFNPGIQLAADNMPQGEVVQVDLRRYTGRQNQVHFIMHFSNCVVDLGRKGFHKDFVDLAKALARAIVEREFSKVKSCLRVDDFRKNDIVQQDKLSNWKQKLSDHEKSRPLLLKNDNFFKPLHEISVTAEPSREQDVIALFNQLVAGGVVRGIKVVGTNELMTYDGAFRVICGPGFGDHEFDETINPLGIGASYREEFENAYPNGFVSNEMKILEYKYSVDGLIHDVTTGDKKIADIDLIVAWEFGSEYEQFFSVQSLLIPEGEAHRQYHGVTHLLFDEHGNHVMDAILLKDLIDFLNDPLVEQERQVSLYE